MEEKTSRRRPAPSRQAKTKKLTAWIVVKRTLQIVLTTVLAIVLALVITLATICNGPSEEARDIFVTTVLESGNLKFLASVFLSEEKIQEIVDSTSMEKMEGEVDDSLINIDVDSKDDFEYDENGIALVKVTGRTFSGKMLIIKDPSQVSVGSTYPWTEYGKEIDKIVTEAGAVAGVNGGLYAADGNKGGSPYGVCVSNGEIQYCNPGGWPGLYLIGMDESNILRIIDIDGLTAAELKQLVIDQKIRDAVAFQEESSDANNHFVTLVLNGEARELNGKGSGLNPRTAIGQREDGAILLLVTGGRGANGHLGASASDLISIMMEYGAVNAANLDGGSSSCMYYNDNYEMTSVTLYYANSSWRLPTAFLVSGKESK